MRSQQKTRFSGVCQHPVSASIGVKPARIVEGLDSLQEIGGLALWIRRDVLMKRIEPFFAEL